MRSKRDTSPKVENHRTDVVNNSWSGWTNWPKVGNVCWKPSMRAQWRMYIMIRQESLTNRSATVKPEKRDESQEESACDFTAGARQMTQNVLKSNTHMCHIASSASPTHKKSPLLSDLGPVYPAPSHTPHKNSFCSHKLTSAYPIGWLSQ